MTLLSSLLTSTPLIQILCRGSDTLGKEGFALGKAFAESSARQRHVGSELIGKEGFVESRMSGSRQRPSP
jgi:hypothetical protein